MMNVELRVHSEFNIQKFNIRLCGMIEERFRLREHQTDVRTEVIGGATTFVTLSYIIFVQPAVLRQMESRPVHTGKVSR